MPATREHPAPAEAPAASLLVDTDVHEYLESLEQLLPYLDNHWQHYMQSTAGLFSDPVPPSAMPYGATVPGPGRLEWIPPDAKPGSSIELMREQLLEGLGVDIAILNGFLYPGALPGNYEYATALASAYNDWQIEHWLEREPRLRGSVQIVPHYPDQAVREIERVAEHPQIVQVFLPLVADRQYGDPFYRPIFAAAERLGLVVALHHGTFTQTLFGFPRYFIEWHTIAAPQCGMNQLMSLICNGVFDELPALRVAVLEAGVAWLPWFMWRLDQQYREMRAEVPWVKRLPSEHMRDSIRIATQPLGDIRTADFRRLIEMTESEEMYVYASDYPHYDADTADTVLPPSLGEDLRRRIRGGNALESYPRLAV